MEISTQKDRQPGQTYSRIVSKIQKGFTAAYPTQSSIPVKYKSSVIPESEKKGFNSQAKRFYHKTDDIPGPGFYNVTHQSPVSNSVSLSKRGTCAFPSMRARLDTIVSKYPAANAYTLPSRFVSKKDFSNSCSSMFQLPSFGKVLKTETPAPNHYNSSNTLDALKCIMCGLTNVLNFWSVQKNQDKSHAYKFDCNLKAHDFRASVSCCKQRNNVSARAGFVSKTQRGFCTSTEGAPAPGHYNINESLVKPSPKVLMSCFKSKTGRGFKVTSTGPGPGYYNPNEHVKIPTKTVIPRNPNLKFSAPPLPLPPAPPLPGPGQYEIVDYNGPPKLFVSSASFVSNTSRWTAVPTQPSLPGPATYQPEFPGKQSFLYNEDNKWIPVL